MIDYRYAGGLIGIIILGIYMIFNAEHIVSLLPLSFYDITVGKYAVFIIVVFGIFITLYAVFKLYNMLRID